MLYCASRDRVFWRVVGNERVGRGVNIVIKGGQVMGLFSFLFGTKEADKNTGVSGANKNNASKKGNAYRKGMPDAAGLYPSDLVMLSIAEKYKVTETNFPSFLFERYQITDPERTLRELEEQGFLKVGRPKDALSGFKVAELKEIASELGIQVKGKKADIISQLSEIDDEMLGAIVTELTWKLTERGQEELKANPYVQYFLDRHSYDVTEVFVTIWTVNEEFVKNPGRPYRDIIYRQLNDQMNRNAALIEKDPLSGSSRTHVYCECYRLMGLFIEDEGKSYINAADLYFQYIFKRINIHAGLQMMVSYKLARNNRSLQAEAINSYYYEAKLLPFHKEELRRLIKELGTDGQAVRDTMITSFKRANDKGIMTEEAAAEFIFLEMEGKSDAAMKMASRLARQAIKKV